MQKSQDNSSQIALIHLGEVQEYLGSHEGIIVKGLHSVMLNNIQLDILRIQTTSRAELNKRGFKSLKGTVLIAYDESCQAKNLVKELLRYMFQLDYVLVHNLKRLRKLTQRNQRIFDANLVMDSGADEFLAVAQQFSNLSAEGIVKFQKASKELLVDQKDEAMVKRVNSLEGLEAEFSAKFQELEEERMKLATEHGKLESLKTQVQSVIERNKNKKERSQELNCQLKNIENLNQELIRRQADAPPSVSTERRSFFIFWESRTETRNSSAQDIKDVIGQNILNKAQTASQLKSTDEEMVALYNHEADFRNQLKESEKKISIISINISRKDEELKVIKTRRDSVIGEINTQLKEFGQYGKELFHTYQEGQKLNAHLDTIRQKELFTNNLTTVIKGVIEDLKDIQKAETNEEKLDDLEELMRSSKYMLVSYLNTHFNQKFDKMLSASYKFTSLQAVEDADNELEQECCRNILA